MWNSHCFSFSFIKVGIKSVLSTCPVGLVVLEDEQVSRSSQGYKSLFPSSIICRLIASRTKSTVVVKWSSLTSSRRWSFRLPVETDETVYLSDAPCQLLRFIHSSTCVCCWCISWLCQPRAFNSNNRKPDLSSDMPSLGYKFSRLTAESDDYFEPYRQLIWGWYF